MSIARALAFLILLALALTGCGLRDLDLAADEWTPAPGAAQPAPLASREDCAHRNPLRRPLFGDLHIHSGFSMDARALGTTTTPDDAYRFARGETIDIFSGEVGTPQTAQIDRPLDFAAVTDHAEWLSEVRLCTDPTSAVYDTQSCKIFRGDEQSWITRLLGIDRGFLPKLIGLLQLDGKRSVEVCGEDSARCRAELRTVWHDVKDSAERFYDRSSACRFTTFHAWEYSRSPNSTKIHRNVILRNELSPEIPISAFETGHERNLWPKLRDLCNATGTGCEAIAIPHNPNLSNGRMFEVWYREEGEEMQRAEAALRAEIEPIVEMSQIKGDSECRNNMFEVLGGTDELCDYEKVRDLPQLELEDCREGADWGATASRGCISRVDYVRYALLEGVRERNRIGVNPFKFGFIGSTDNHMSTPGQVEEWEQPYKFGMTEERVLTIGDAPRASAYWNPGGLAGVWAEENSRDSIFDAMKRREAFATSGPRIVPRFFGGWDLPKDLCETDNLVETGYTAGVPMGSDLPMRDTDASPTFVMNALRDPGTESQPGGLLQRLQVVKGWVDDEGRFNQEVIDVAGDADNGADVDLDSCTPRGPGTDRLCAVWQDPNFDATRDAVYYARTVENPSCRWSTRMCNEWEGDTLPDGCTDPRLPKTIQERAWTSPIWYTAN
jgi:hypothetical protein